MKKPVIICVDDEKFFLTSLKNEISRIFGNNIVVEIAESGEEALEVINELIESGYEIPIIISDYVMNGMYGDEFLKICKEKFPASKKILLTGQATLEGVKNAINDAELYRYIIKPWDSTDLNLTLSEAFRIFFKEKLIDLQRKHIAQSNKELQDKINFFKDEIEKKYNEKHLNLVKSSNQNLSEIFEFAINLSKTQTENPVIKRISRIFEVLTNLFDKSCEDLYLYKSAIIISHLYLFYIDSKIAEKLLKEELINSKEIKIVEKAKKKAFEELKTISLFVDLNEAVYENFDYLDNTDDLKLEKKNERLRKTLILTKLLIYNDIFISDGLSLESVISSLKSMNQFDERLINILGNKKKTSGNKIETINKEEKNSIEVEVPKIEYVPVSFMELKQGYVLAENLCDTNGNLLVPMGQEIFEDLILVLMKYRHHCQIKEPIYIIRDN